MKQNLDITIRNQSHVTLTSADTAKRTIFSCLSDVCIPILCAFRTQIAQTHEYIYTIVQNATLSKDAGLISESTSFRMGFYFLSTQVRLAAADSVSHRNTTRRKMSI